MRSDEFIDREEEEPEGSSSTTLAVLASTSVTQEPSLSGTLPLVKVITLGGAAWSVVRRDGHCLSQHWLSESE